MESAPPQNIFQAAHQRAWAATHGDEVWQTFSCGDSDGSPNRHTLAVMSCTFCKLSRWRSARPELYPFILEDEVQGSTTKGLPGASSSSLISVRLTPSNPLEGTGRSRKGLACSARPCTLQVRFSDTPKVVIRHPQLEGSSGQRRLLLHLGGAWEKWPSPSHSLTLLERHAQSYFLPQPQTFFRA